MILDTRALVSIALEARTGMDILHRRGLGRVAVLADPANLRRLAS